MQPLIRSADSGDRAVLLELADRLREGVAQWRDTPAVLSAVKGWVEKAADGLDDASQSLLVAEEDGRVVGFVSVSDRRHWSGEGEAYIGELVVEPSSEGRGIGTGLVDAAMAWARSRGHGRIAVSTGAANLRARRLYERLGFEEEDITLSAPL